MRREKERGKEKVKGTGKESSLEMNGLKDGRWARKFKGNEVN